MKLNKKSKHTEPVIFKVSPEMLQMIKLVAEVDGDGNLSLALRKLIERRYFELSQSAL